MKNVLTLIIILLIGSCSEKEPIEPIEPQRHPLLETTALYFDIDESDIQFTLIDTTEVVIIQDDMVYILDSLKTILTADEDTFENARVAQRNNGCTRGSINLPFPSGKTGILWRNSGTDYNYEIHYRIIGSVPTVWQQATRDAFNEWNSLASNRIKFREVFCGTTSTHFRGINVKLGSWAPSNQLARATVGSHYIVKSIWINQSAYSYTTRSLASATRVMVHEIGHNLGYRHTNQTSGCLIPGTGVDNNSIMRSFITSTSLPIFSAGDIAAHNIVYSNVAKPVAVCMGSLRGCPGNTGTCK
ncbi:MAG: M57 family metalloprotease [Reichenbachiella sp.]